MVFDIKSILLLISQLPLCCRLLSQLNQSPGNTLKPSARFHLGYSVHRVRLPSDLLTSVHSNLILQRHSRLLLFALIHIILQITVKPLRETNWTLQQARRKNILTGVSFNRKAGTRRRKKKKKRAGAGQLRRV